MSDVRDILLASHPDGDAPTVFRAFDKARERRLVQSVSAGMAVMGSIVLYSNTPVPAPTHIVRRLREHGRTDGTLRLVVLPTPLDEPQASEVATLGDQSSVRHGACGRQAGSSQTSC